MKPGILYFFVPKKKECRINGRKIVYQSDVKKLTKAIKQMMDTACVEDEYVRQLMKIVDRSR